MCGSGMRAAMFGHDQLVAGTSDIVVAGGLESMTNAPYLLDKARGGYRMGNGKIYDHMFLDGLEDAGRRKVDPRALREAYIEEFNAHNEGLARHARSLDIDYVLLDTSQPVDQAIATYLARRSARVKTGGGR
jgi:acetyl-CoA acetyltransferase